MSSKIKQLRFPDIELEEKDFVDEWSENLIKDLGIVTSLGIYALPGSTFKINQTELIQNEETLVINGLGTFSINTEEHPIKSIQLSKESYNLISSNNNFIILDLIYEEVPQNVK